MIKNINNWLEEHIYKIIISFLFIQPILDVITAIGINYFHLSINVSSIIRLLFFIFCIYYLIFLNKNESKKKYLIYLFLYFVYLFLFLISIISLKGIDVVSYELQNSFNIFYLPIVLLGLKGIFNQYKLKISLKQIFLLFSIYLLFVLIPNLFNLGFSSYEHSKVGNIGWFLSANTIGSILSILLPLILISFRFKKEKVILKVIFIFLTLFVFFSIGTKVPVFSVIIITITNIIYLIVKWMKGKKYLNISIIALALITITISIILLLPKTSFYKNIMIHKKFLKIEHYSEVLTNPKILDHFVFSQRLTFLKQTHHNYINGNSYEKILGIGFIENYGTDQIRMKTIEIDYFEIFYRSGIIGFILYFTIFIPNIASCFKKIRKFNLLNIEYFTILLLILLLAFFQGHILITPSVSIFVILIIVFIQTKSLEYN